MSSTPLSHLETAFYEMFPDAANFYKGLKSLMINAPDGTAVDVPVENGLPTPPKHLGRKEIKKRIVNIVGTDNVVKTSSQIVKKLLEIDPETTTEISPFLTALKKEGILVNHSPTRSRRDTYWGIINWIRPDGTFEEEYLPENYY